MDKSVSIEGLVFKHTFPMQKSQNEAGEQVFVGVASSTSIDRDNERLSKAALIKGAKDLMKNPTVFFNHQHSGLGLGKVINAYPVDNKLMVEWVPSTAKAVQDHITQINEGVLRSMSIAGSVQKATNAFDEDLQKNIRTIEDVNIYEVSVVGIPANPDATISGSIAKAFDVEKSRLATTITDDNKETKGDGSETDEKSPVVPAKKKKAKDGEVIDDDEEHESAKKKGAKKSVSESGDSVEEKTADVDVAKSNQPAPTEGLSPDLARLESIAKEILSKIDVQKSAVVGSVTRTEDVDWKKRFEDLSTRLDVIEKGVVGAKGLSAPGALESDAGAAVVKYSFE